MSEWISVKKRLPDEELKKFRDLNGLENGIGHINVLGSTGKHTLKNTVEYDGKNFWYEGRWMNSEITHWMPLPEPPEDEAMECDSCRYQNDCLLDQSDLVKKCKCYEPKKIKTNADRIRSMSDEELDMFLREVKNRAKIIILGNTPGLLKQLVDIDWLQQPVKKG